MLSFAEIGKRMGCSGETARSVCEQALAKLRKELENDPERAAAIKSLLTMPGSSFPWGAKYKFKKEEEE